MTAIPEPFVELAAASNFSFLRGASHPEEIVVTAAALGIPGIAVCDRNTLAGVVRAHIAGKEVGIRTAVGCRLVFSDGTPDILAWPTDRAAYGRLCRLLTVGNLRGEKNDCRLDIADLAEWCDGLVLAIVAESGTLTAITAAASALVGAASEPVRLAINRPYGADDQRAILGWAQLCRETELRPLATNLPLYHAPERRSLQDVLTAIREHTTVEAAGRLLRANAERHLKPPSEMARLFDPVPEALPETIHVMERLAFSLDELRYEYPEEPTDPGLSPQETLTRLAWTGAHRRYPQGVPEHVRHLVQHELKLIEGLAYAPYFLTVHDIVWFARDRGILAQGRGSAANSAVCFCLGITEVDPERGNLLFERFISPERREPPDIDVDFEHERREEVIQHIYAKYGRDRAGIAATVISYRARSAAREIGKALGFSEDAVSAVSGSIWGWSNEGVEERDAERAGLNPQDHRISHLVRLSQEIAGFPRHLSQHVGGFVITRGRLDELVPVVKAAMDGRTNIEWDKDDIDSLGILKIDVLGLGMLTCLRRALGLLADHYVEDAPAAHDALLPAFSASAACPVTHGVALDDASDLRRNTATHLTGELRTPAEFGVGNELASLAEFEPPGSLGSLSKLGPRSELGRPGELEPPGGVEPPCDLKTFPCLHLFALPTADRSTLAAEASSPFLSEQPLDGAQSTPILTGAPEKNADLITFRRLGDEAEEQEISSSCPSVAVDKRFLKDDCIASSRLLENYFVHGTHRSRKESGAEANRVGPSLFQQPASGSAELGSWAVRPHSQDFCEDREAVAAQCEGNEQWHQTTGGPEKTLTMGVESSIVRAFGQAIAAFPAANPNVDAARGDPGAPLGPVVRTAGAKKTGAPGSNACAGEVTRTADRGGEASDKAHSAIQNSVALTPQPVAPLGTSAGKLLHSTDQQRVPVTIAMIPAEDPQVYEMICRADTLGVFQIESRAQMTMLPRLKPKTFYDLVIEVAIVRPGPIQGDMVHPYLRRRQGREKVSYPSQELERVLGKTLGVPLFQEQAMSIAIVAAGFTPSEADQLRRAMATFKKVGTIGTFQQKMIDGMTKRGYDPAFAERCFRQIEGFGEYGFPESHAASFALLVYSSCWLKCHYPDVFCAALLNSQPMGFYAPAQIVRDARQHGVEVRPVDVNLSDWDCTLEPGPRAAEHLAPEHASMKNAIRSSHAVRLGLRQVKGLSEDDMHLLVARRGSGYDSVRDVWLRTGLARATVERLADADAFGSLGHSRRDALWAARGLDRVGRAEDLPLFAAAATADLQRETAANLPPMPPGEEVINDYRFLSLSLKAHPAGFVRPALNAERVAPAATLTPRANGRRLSVAGLVLVRQRPGSAKGVIFMTVEDETGIANVIVWPKVFEAHRQVVLGARFIKVTGRVQAEDNVVHLVAERLEDRTPLLAALTEELGDWDALDRADEVKRPSIDLRTAVKPRSRLARLVAETPDLRGEAAQMLATNRALIDAIASNRSVAEAIASGHRTAPPAEGTETDPPPAPISTWGTARSAACDLSNLGETTRKTRTRNALPKGRNFQ